MVNNLNKKVEELLNWKKENEDFINELKSNKETKKVKETINKLNSNIL